MTPEANPKPSETPKAVQPPIPVAPAIPEDPLPAPPEPSIDLVKQLGKWTRFILAGNPFYILSAVLVLWSMDRLSLDSRIFSGELPQLYFNVSAFQVYEALLVVTAIFLSARGIAYDSGLLVGLENLFIAVPFILVSQVLLTESPAALVLCLAGCALVIIRTGALKRYVHGIRMPGRLLAAGLILLIANLSMPMLMRWLHKDADFGVWYERAGSLGTIEWLLIAPLCVALGYLLPKSAEKTKTTGTALYLQTWFPLCALLLWVAGTVAHFYCIGYVYGFRWEWVCLLPTFWLGSWVIWNRRDDFDFVRAAARAKFEHVLGVVPVLLLAWGMEEGDWQTTAVLSAFNVAIYGGLALRKERWYRQLCLVSTGMAVAALPLEWVRAIGSNAGRAELIAGAIACLLTFKAVLSRNPKLGVLGAIVTPMIIAGLVGPRLIQTNFALVQIGLVFLLLHSLRWDDAREAGADKARALAVIMWIANSALWLANYPANGLYGTIVSAAIVLGVYSVCGKLLGNWGPRILPMAAVAVLALKPMFLACKLGSVTCDLAGKIPTGLLILGSGFGMFALGTILALARHHGKLGFNRTHGRD